jgi:medium-chain acyl-[acyl-carrier-protein] hydrolase
MTLSSMTVTDNAWILSSQASMPPRLRLFCLPYAGGGAAAFARWADLLPPAVELCRVQLPGRENRWREAPFTQLAVLVETLAAVIRPYLDLPFTFFGHSLGALLSFELTRQVRRQFDLHPAQLFVSGRWAPHLPNPDPPLYQQPDAEFIDTLRQRYNNIPDVVANDPELLEIFLPLLRADVTLLDTYIYTAERPLDCPITAYGGNADQRVSRAALEAWRTHTTQSFHVRLFPGAHFYLQAEQAALLQAMSPELAALLGQL